VSATLLEAAISEPEALLRRLAPTLEITQGAVDLAVVKQLVQEIRPTIQVFRIPEEPNTWYDGTARPFKDALVEFTGDELVAQIVYEEWYFLVSESWVFSKTRRAFDAMVEAGGTAIQMSQRVFDRVVRRQLKKEPDEPLTPSNLSKQQQSGSQLADRQQWAPSVRSRCARISSLRLLFSSRPLTAQRIKN
jgi:hypothetical protein